MTDALRVIVCGYIVRGPLGGLAWHHLQYVVGLHRMGHDVVFVEDSDDYESCYDPSRGTVDTDPTYGLAFAADAFSRVGLRDRWSYYDAHTREWHGPLGARGAGVFDGAEVILNLSGVNPPRAWWDAVPNRVLVDTDPVFTQLRHLQDPHAAAVARAHTSFFTFGENAGRAEGLVPDDGLPWQPTRQPVVLDLWPLVDGASSAAWTTVMQWDSYGERRHDGLVYGMKSRSFDEIAGLPGRAGGERFELALGSANAPRERLRQQGWSVVDPLAVTRDPWTFQAYVRASKGELSVAKHGYVAARTGWFSERTAGYLASGRPAVVEDTGFSRFIGTGDGLFSFTTEDEALAALHAVNERYDHHCRAARLVAEAEFDHERVLGALLDRAALC